MPKRPLSVPSGLPKLTPMLAATAPLPTDSGQWSAEVKWDGWRVLAYLDGAGGLRLVSRGGRRIEQRLPELAEVSRSLPGTDMILDGEVIATGPDGRPDFGRLQHRLHSPEGAEPDTDPGTDTDTVRFMVFDVLWLSGLPTIGLGYAARRELLEHLALDTAHVAAPPAWSDIAQAVEWTREHHLEGVVCKRLDSTYQPGIRSTAWIKHRFGHSMDIIIGGWIPGDLGMKSLMMGVREPGGLRYLGNVGSGFTTAERTALADALRALDRPDSPFQLNQPDPPIEGARWVLPLISGAVDYYETTSGGLLRQPIWRGLRDPSE